jgi:hypothetical protein
VPRKEAQVDENGRTYCKVQFTIYDEDVADFLGLLDEGETAAPVAKRLFQHGLSWCAKACGEYATPHQKKRRARLGLD